MVGVPKIAPASVSPSMTTPTKTKISFSVLLLAVAACGDRGLVDEDYEGEPLVIIEGSLGVTGATAPSSPISLAIQWVPAVEPPDLPPPGEFTPPRGPPVCDGTAQPVRTATSLGRENRGWVSQSVTYQAQFPIAFQIPVTTLPPPTARLDLAQLGHSGTLSIGMLVAYVDTNQNGRFDLGQPGQAGDELLAASADVDGELSQVIVYMDGSIGPRPPPGQDNWVDEFLDYYRGLPLGFSLLGTSGTVATPMPVTTPITMNVGDNASGRDELAVSCSYIERRTVRDGPTPSNAEIYCNGGGYSWRLPDAYPEPCVELVTEGQVCLAAGVTPPPGYPCP